MTSMSLRPLMGMPTDASQPSAKARAVVSPWAWMIVTCLLLGLSGGIRFWRDARFSALAVESSACPFPLVELPKSMGTWQGTEEEAQLDPEVLRFAGASEHIVRTYLDEKTGEQAAALALYGLGTQVYGHVPEICYPAAGYQLFKGPVDRSISVPGLKAPVRYRWALYTKRAGGAVRYEEVYHTFFHHGEWLPEAAGRWKMFRYYPGLFKIQIAHPTSGVENGDGPCLPLLAEFARQIERRVAPAQSGESGVATTVPASR